jgi:hypothetical protein
MIDPTERKSVIHCFSTANSPVGPYGPIEIVLMMTFNETVSKLVTFLENMSVIWD